MRARAGGMAALLLSPTLLVLGLVVGYPLLAAFRESLYRSGDELDADGFLVSGDRFVGLDNYADALGSRFWTAFGNTSFFTFTTVAIEVVVGTAMALVMHKVIRGRGLVRASILVPWAIPTAVSGLLWRWVFQSDGVANQVLGTDLLWTSDGWAAKVAVIIADTWKTAPFVGLLVLAGLQLIPAEVNEAARLDGASAWQRLWRVTLPLVKPALLVAVLFRLLDALRMFDLPFVLVGQQKGSVETLSMLAWSEANQVRYGPAAAYSVILFLYVVLIAFVFVKLLGADLLGERRKKEASV
ncbi:carbohydrate ABC transporter permease [Allokutzneria oryzae]|uniref:Carbohydrate ABC transporter permease n=1 Tax=Allokutzneria oryzae TaxID=1378989 RepID=A0ABV5ZWW4_9PSEU